MPLSTTINSSPLLFLALEAFHQARLILKEAWDQQIRPVEGSQEELIPLRLYCVACGAHITSNNQAITVQGRHHHVRVNPAGMVFVLRCFLVAPGVVMQGAPSTVFTWFPGLSWQVALCSSCHTQVGWFFSGTRSFYALITEKIKN